jgi:2',3'-cyclic-nucleotide 2'-phosphodiesterase (5'-nucleotidase family)
MDTFLLTTLLEHTGAEIGFSNGWRYGAPIPAGPIRLNDLYNMVPMNPPVSTVDLSGKELKKMLEENLEHTFSRDPFAQMGGYVKRALGLRVFFKVENPPGERIHKIFVGEREIRSDEVYRAAFITEQGVPPNLGHNRQQHPEKIIPVMQTYLKKFGPLEIEPSGAFQLI